MSERADYNKHLAQDTKRRLKGLQRTILKPRVLSATYDLPLKKKPTNTIHCSRKSNNNNKQTKTKRQKKNNKPTKRTNKQTYKMG